MDALRDDEVHTYGPVLFRDEYTGAAAQRHACYVTLQGVSHAPAGVCGFLIQAQHLSGLHMNVLLDYRDAVKKSPVDAVSLIPAS